MSKSLELWKRADPEPVFRWRDREGNHYLPSSMRTRHLFYVLRMIWNHSVPEPMRILPYRHYRFGKFYTAEYMKRAVLAIGRELLNRDDLTAEQWSTLERMARSLHAVLPAIV
jgi:predicted site-specific integrase-resolvase